MKQTINIDNIQINFEFSFTKATVLDQFLKVYVF